MYGPVRHLPGSMDRCRPAPAETRAHLVWRDLRPPSRYTSTALPSSPVQLSPMTTAPRPSALDRARVRAVVRRLFGLGLLALGGVIATMTLIAIVQLMSRSEIVEGRQVVLLARDAHTLLVDRESDVRGYLLGADATARPAPALGDARLDRTLDALRAEMADEPDAQARVDALRVLAARWDTTFVAPAVAAGRRGDFDTARRGAVPGMALADSARAVAGDLIQRAMRRLQRRDRSMVVLR